MLREDLYLELRGIESESIGLLDENGSNWRSIYFFRNSTRTLMEIRSAIEALRSEKIFLDSLAGQPEFKKAYEGLQQAMDKAHSVLKPLRNEISGHLKDKAFKGGLKKIDTATKQLFQGGDNPKNIHYKFALELIGATMLRGARKHPARKWNTILNRISNTSFKAIHAIDTLFYRYVERRHLLE